MQFNEQYDDPWWSGAFMREEQRYKRQEDEGKRNIGLDGLQAN